MGQALYRKHRSKSLGDIVGQQHITMTLQNALKKGRISHAYLFTGPRGVGKTSVARILAHAINDLPYDSEQAHLDIIEIDAASNRRIDEIRDLRERVHVAPTSAKFKVYIIDEVHMLTKEAFNALLKTLEEPPAHVVFILATTEAHKLPETIISRTQRFNFRPINQSDAVAHLGQIAAEEKLDINPEALKLIAEHGEGSFRDSISLLDQASGLGQKITHEDVQAMLGVPPESAVAALLEALESGQGSMLISKLGELHEQGHLATHIAKRLAALIRQQIIDGTAGPTATTKKTLLRELIEVPAAHDPLTALELTLLDHLPEPQDRPVEPPAKLTVAKSPEPAAAESKEKKSQTKKATVIETNGPPISEKQTPTHVPGPTSAAWDQLLHDLKQRHSTLYGIIRMAQPSFGKKEVTLEFSFPFHQKRINEDRSKEILASLIEKHFGKDHSFTTSLGEKKPTTMPAAATDRTASLSAISSIFGGGEMLD